MAAYPEYVWDSSYFKRPRHYWSSRQSQRHFFDSIAKRLSIYDIVEFCITCIDIETAEEWYKVSVHTVCRMGGASLLNMYYHGSLTEALKAVYGGHSWMNYSYHHPHQKTKEYRGHISKAQCILPHVHGSFTSRIAECGANSLSKQYCLC